MVKKVLKTIVTSGLIFGVFSSSVFATTGKVTGNNVRIREKADSKSIEVSVATKNEKVEIHGEEGNWYHIKFEKVTGYISKDFVDTDYNSGGSNSTVETPPAQENTEPEPNKEPEVTTPEVTNTEPEVPAEENVTNSETPATPVQEPESTPVQEEQQVVDEVKYEKNQTITFEQDASLRYLPSFISRECGTVANGGTYTVKETLNNWVKVESDTNSGWVLKTSISGSVTNTESTPTETDNSISTETSTPENNPSSTTETNNSTVSKGKVNVDSARIRKAPDGEALDTLSKGEEVTILSEEGDWYKIKTNDYDSCYIAKRLITEL